MTPSPQYRLHAVQRMFERGISIKNVGHALESGETIEDYSADMGAPGRLILGSQGKRAFHVVASEDPRTGQITVITVYTPDLDRWKKDHRTRR